MHTVDIAPRESKAKRRWSCTSAERWPASLGVGLYGTLPNQSRVNPIQPRSQQYCYLCLNEGIGDNGIIYHDTNANYGIQIYDNLVTWKYFKWNNTFKLQNCNYNNHRFSPLKYLTKILSNFATIYPHMDIFAMAYRPPWPHRT